MRRRAGVSFAAVLLLMWPLAASAGGGRGPAAAAVQPSLRADFNGDGAADLAIGAPGESLGPGQASAGIVQVLYGSSGGLTATGGQLWSQDTPGVAGGPEFLDFFGLTLAAS